MSLNQLVAEFSFSTPSAPPLTYSFKLTGTLREYTVRSFTLTFYWSSLRIT